jgi:hypothetical protein
MHPKQLAVSVTVFAVQDDLKAFFRALLGTPLNDFMVTLVLLISGIAIGPYQ